MLLYDLCNNYQIQRSFHTDDMVFAMLLLSINITLRKKQQTETQIDSRSHIIL